MPTMRPCPAWITALVVVAACGKSGNAPTAADDAPPIPDASAPVHDAAAPDAFELPACANPVAGSTINFRKVGQVAGIATLAISPPADPRLFAVAARGQIFVLIDGVQQPTPFIDLSIANGGPVVSTSAGTELGLLGLVFHPRYADNGIFFVYYTTGDVTKGTLRDVVARCTVSAADPNIANPTCDEILSMADPAVNHNGGMMEFGSDGELYIGTGDGGGTTNNPLDPNKLLGKMLRIDVDHPTADKPYAIPSDNPFANGGGAPEVWMIGLRNPWRWSFDHRTGDLWIPDVGGELVEELDVVSRAEQPGANLGWTMYEGSVCAKPPCDPTGKIFPKLEGTHPTWEAIIGGQTYRGTCYPDLVGWFFFGDFSGFYKKARLRADRSLEVVDVLGTFPPHPTSFHEDGHHEIYMTDSSGFIYHLEAAAP
jgi:glucose/arabinose dehydrogenase